MFRAWLVVVMLAACGRFRFDAIATDASGGQHDTNAADAIVPVANIAFMTSSTHEPGQLGILANADAIRAVRAGEAGPVYCLEL